MSVVCVCVWSDEPHYAPCPNARARAHPCACVREREREGQPVRPKAEACLYTLDLAYCRCAPNWPQISREFERGKGAFRFGRKHVCGGSGGWRARAYFEAESVSPRATAAGGGFTTALVESDRILVKFVGIWIRVSASLPLPLSLSLSLSLPLQYSRKVSQHTS
jgi:hypothetical protein